MLFVSTRRYPNPFKIFLIDATTNRNSDKLQPPGEHVQNGDHSDAHVSTFSHSSKEVNDNANYLVCLQIHVVKWQSEFTVCLVLFVKQDISTEGSPKKDKKKKKGLRTPSFLKKKKEKKKETA